MDDFVTWLGETKPTRGSRRCSTCSHPAADLIVQFLDRKAAGLTYVSLEQLRRDFLKPKVGYNLTTQSLTRHIKLCLERSPKTGLPYHPERDPETMRRINQLREETNG